MKFKSKPTEIEAEQFLPDRKRALADQTFPKGVCTKTTCSGLDVNDRIRPHIHTMHDNQIVVLKDGDWIVPEPDGEHFYPIDDAVFRSKYEPVE